MGALIPQDSILLERYINPQKAAPTISLTNEIVLGTTTPIITTLMRFMQDAGPHQVRFDHRMLCYYQWQTRDQSAPAFSKIVVACYGKVMNYYYFWHY